MTRIEIRPADAGRYDDVAHALSGGGDGRSCQCQWWTMSRAEWDASTREDRAGRLRTELDDTPAPGLVGHVDGVAAGWVRVGPRTAQPRLARTRRFAASPEPFDAPDVWAVTCFVVRREFRGRALAARLLTAAVGQARDGGARVLEAYPTDVAAHEGALSPNELYRGTVSMFARAGFEVVARPRPDLAIMHLHLAGREAR